MTRQGSRAKAAQNVLITFQGIPGPINNSMLAAAFPHHTSSLHMAPGEQELEFLMCHFCWSFCSRNTGSWAPTVEIANGLFKLDIFPCLLIGAFFFNFFLFFLSFLASQWVMLQCWQMMCAGITNTWVQETCQAFNTFQFSEQSLQQK
jgi:hypothetical protein